MVNPACDGLEFDVVLRPRTVVIHDVTLRRVQGRPERIDAMTADALDDLGMPTLADVLAAVGRRTFLDIELKGDPGVRDRGPGGRSRPGPRDRRRVVVPSRRPGGRRPGSPGVAAMAEQQDARRDGRADAVGLGCRGVDRLAIARSGVR